jgi:hypothetical protein
VRGFTREKTCERFQKKKCENVWHGGPLVGELKGGQQHGVCIERRGNKVENKGLWMVIGLGFFDVAHHISFNHTISHHNGSITSS